MTGVSRGAASPVVPFVETDDWVARLSAPGPDRDAALRQLHSLLLRAARHQVSRMTALVAGLGAERVDELVNQSADEAMVALLGKLSTFEGRSRFTTWAYKFAVLHAAVEIRRLAWVGREIPLEQSVEPWSSGPSPEDYSEAAALSAAITKAIDTALTPHQRQIVIAVLIDDVPIDILADRLGSSRNALYKTLHDARHALRLQLIAAGHLPAAQTAGWSR